VTKEGQKGVGGAQGARGPRRNIVNHRYSEGELFRRPESSQVDGNPTSLIKLRGRGGKRKSNTRKGVCPLYLQAVLGFI